MRFTDDQSWLQERLLIVSDKSSSIIKPITRSDERRFVSTAWEMRRSAHTTAWLQQAL